MTETTGSTPPALVSCAQSIAKQNEEQPYQRPAEVRKMGDIVPRKLIHPQIQFN